MAKSGGGGNDGNRKRQQQGNGHENQRRLHRQRSRVRDGNAHAASATNPAFLAALEAQRAKQTAEDAARPPDAGASMASSQQQQEGMQQSRETAAALPGLFYDETKGRYFKLTKHQQHLQQRRRVVDAAKADAAQTTLAQMTRRHISSSSTCRRRGWMAFLAERETWNSSLTRHQQLVPRYYAARMPRQALSSVDILINTARDRFSAVDISQDGTSLVAGYASGLIRSFQVEPSDPNVSTTRLAPLAAIRSSQHTVSSVQHQHLGGNCIALALVGAGVASQLTSLLPRGAGQPNSGRVDIFRDATFDRICATLPFTDPWIVQWSLLNANQLSVGLNRHDHGGAAIVDLRISGEGRCSSGNRTAITSAPRGCAHSDTLSQAFFPQSPSILVNGTRSGSWWMWDVRAPRLAVADDENKAATGTSSTHGAIQCLRVLSDERRMVMQHSDGHLAVYDVRTHRSTPVVLLATGTSGVYRSMLQFDLDETESVVAAATTAMEPPHHVAFYDVSRGSPLGQLSVPVDSIAGHPSLGPSSTAPQCIQWRESTENGMRLWASSHTALYQSRQDTTD